jgi:hypothetical protein
VPNLTSPAGRVPRPPLHRLLAFFAVVTLCLAVDVLVVFGLYKAASALLTGLGWQALGQAAFVASVLLYLLYRVHRGVRSRNPVAQDGDQESVSS